MRRSHRKWKPEKIQEAICLYNTGLSLSQVAKQIGGKYATVARHLRDNGIEVRPRAHYSQGDRNPAWKTGRRRVKGYVYVYAPNHPHRTKKNKVSEHRLVMEQKLGRYLKPTEVVDHINGIPDDNRPENLRLFSSNGEHLRSTRRGRCPKWSEEGRARLRAPKSEEHRRKISESKRGQSLSDEHRRKISQARKRMFLERRLSRTHTQQTADAVQ